MSFADNTVSGGSAYLYKVCAADGPGNCVSTYSNLALGATVTFPTDPTITSIVDDPSGVNVTKVKSAHITELRSAVNAVRSLAGWGAASWTNPAAAGDFIYKEDVRDMREKLDEALVQLAIQISAYTDSPLAGGSNGTPIRKTHITELRERTKSGSGTAGSGGSSRGVRYVLSDVQGSSRAVMNNGTYGSSAIVARHDYLPFGEEIGSGTGLRTGTQGYGASDTNRRKYGLTERDDATGLDHTWWRKYESTSGRWTSPDPYNGSMTVANPQSFNRYSYVQNDPVNLVDPSGLRAMMCGLFAIGDGNYGFVCFGDYYPFDPYTPKDPNIPEPPESPQKPKTPYVDKDVLNDCTEKLYGVKTIEFQGSTKGQGGSFTGNGPLWENGGYNQDFTVRNNVTAFTKAEAKTWVNAYYKDNNMLPVPQNLDVWGFSPPSQPRLNYTASDINSMDMLKVQVHELGHSLNNLINLKYPGDLGGQKLQDCVAENGGFKSK